MNILFAGTPEFALPSLKALLAFSEHRVLAVYTQPDRPKGRGRRLLKSPIKQLAIENNIPICQPKTLRDCDEQEKLATWQADLMVVVAYGLILPQAVLTIPSLGCINVHASLLPRWRGAAPIQRAILAGDETTGISIMQMDAGLDTGPILQQVACPIEKTDTAQSLQERLAKLGAHALLTSLAEIQQGSHRSQPQSACGISYAKKIDKIEAEIDWQLNVEFIARRIRAFNPKPIAYTFLDQLLVRIWSANVLEKEADSPIKAGTILQVRPQGIDVMTGEGILRLLQIQLAGGRCLPIADILHSKSHLFRVGEVLG